MAERRVVFLDLPQVGIPVQFLFEGRAATSSPVTKVDEQQGWYRVFTQSGSVYIGTLQVQQPAYQRTTYNASPIPTLPTQQPITTDPFAQVQQYPQHPPRKRFRWWMIPAGFAGLIFLAALGSVDNSSTGTNSTPPATSSPSSDYSVSSDSEEQQEDFTLLDWQFSRGEFDTRHITGSIRNNTNRSYGYVQVEFNLYDDAGNQVGSEFTNINNVEPNSTWKFDIILLTDSATQAKFKGITGF